MNKYLTNADPERDNCELCHGVLGGVRGNENVVDGKVICDYCHSRKLDWLVLRHGARSTDNWRLVYRGPEHKARSKYAKLDAALRQGGVELVSPTERVAFATAPRLRTRW